MGEWAKRKLGRKQGKKVPVYFAMFFLWSAMGLWHGNSWKYICGEGWWFWAVIVLGQICDPLFERMKRFLHIKEGKCWRVFQVVRTFLIYSVGILFFRAASLPDAVSMISGSMGIPNVRSAARELYHAQWDNVGGACGIIVCGMAVLAVWIVDRWKYQGVDVRGKLTRVPAAVRWTAYYILLFAIVLFGMFGQSRFIYFQF